MFSHILTNVKLNLIKKLFIFLAEVIEEVIRRIQIHRATEEGKQVKSGFVIKAVDREFGVEEENCHVSSGATGKSWLSFEIEWSFITHVNILVPNTAGRKSVFQVDFVSFWPYEIFSRNDCCFFS